MHLPALLAKVSWGSNNYDESYGKAEPLATKPSPVQLARDHLFLLGQNAIENLWKKVEALGMVTASPADGITAKVLYSSLCKFL